MIRIYISNEISQTYSARIIYTFEELLWRCGERVSIAETKGSADVIYSTNSELDREIAGVAKIRANIELFDRDSAVAAPDLDSVESTRQGVIAGAIDPVGWAFRFLSLSDEQSVVPDRGDGNKLLSSQPIWRQKISNLPIVEYLSVSLATLLEMRGVSCRKYCGLGAYKVLMTHDTDATNLSHPLEIAYNLVKGILRRKPEDLRRSVQGIRTVGKEYDKNPLFGFNNWCRDFPQYGHAFYLSFRGVGKPALNDVRSSASDANFPWSILKSIYETGNIEFGLHPGINTKFDPNQYLVGKEKCESMLGITVDGMRHHYWSLDWRSPESSFRQMANAGFRYDCSMAYPDSFGLRSGTCLPYRPFDIQNNKPLELFVLPTCLMDAWTSVLDRSSTKVLSKMIDEIKVFNGLINVNWHTETICNTYPYNGYIDNWKKIEEEHGLNAQHSLLPRDIVRIWSDIVHSN